MSDTAGAPGSCIVIRVHFDISLWAVHVPGTLNSWADAISRDNLAYFPGALGK